MTKQTTTMTTTTASANAMPPFPCFQHTSLGPPLRQSNIPGNGQKNPACGPVRRSTHVNSRGIPPWESKFVASSAMNCCQSNADRCNSVNACAVFTGSTGSPAVCITLDQLAKRFGMNLKFCPVPGCHPQGPSQKIKMTGSSCISRYSEWLKSAGKHTCLTKNELFWAKM